MDFDAKISKLESDIEKLENLLATVSENERVAIRHQIAATRNEIAAIETRRAAMINSNMKLAGPDTSLALKFEEKVPEASYWLHIDSSRGNAVAVSDTFLLCALHRQVPEGSSVEVVDVHGISRNAKVIKSVFSPMKFDLTLIRIDDEQSRLPFYIPVHRKPVEKKQVITVMGLMVGLSGETGLAVQSSQIFFIEPSSSLFRATYYGAEGFSGAGIIVVVDNNRYELVGVHIATHDATEGPPDIKKSKTSKGAATAESVEEAVSSISSELHGHMAYCLASEPIRTKEIFELIFPY